MDDKKLKDEEQQQHHHQQHQQKTLCSDSETEILIIEKNPRWELTSFILQPMYWFRKLNKDLHWSFVLSVIIVYGISQGLGTGLSRVSTQYYMKDELKLQPSQAQVYSGIIQIPWIIKPLWGLLTDTLPVAAYRRKPYFFLAGFLSTVSMLVLSLNNKVSIALALFSLMIAGAGVAIADVTVDACVTENSISHPSLAGDMQSLCGLSSSVGALVGFSLSGIFVHLIGPKGVFGLLCIPAGLVIFAGTVLRENRIHYFSRRQVCENFVGATKAMWTTVKYKDVWRPCLYMYLSLALNLNIREGIFYWYTDAEDGPKFSQEVVGSIFSFGAIGSLLGVLIYQNFLKNYNFRTTLFWAELLFGASGLLDLVLVLRINLRFGMPDYFFVVFDDAVTQLIGRIKWMPILVLSSKLCPPGIEGTFFALLMSVDHVGMLSSAWTGGFLLHILKVTRTQFNNLWVAILLRSILRITPICLLFLIPKSDPNTNILPSKLLQTEKGHSGDLPESENMEMAALISST